jgi:hypothetical protein
MRRLLTAHEVDLLSQKLVDDGMSAGALHRWAWRRGWLLPPPLFFWFKFGVDMSGVVMACLMMALSEARFRGTYVTMAACLAAIWVVNTPEARQRFGGATMLVVNAGIIGLGVIAWQIWVPKQDWPAVTVFFGLLKIAAIVFGYMVISGFISGRVDARTRRLPRWVDYVEAALVTSHF